jgi:hypothetical protein
MNTVRHASSPHNQKGFGTLELLLVLLVVVVLGAAGWYVWQREQRTTNSTNSSSTSSGHPVPPPTPDPYKGWLTYTDSQQHYSFKYPASGWTLTGSTDSVSVRNAANTALVSYNNPFVKDSSTTSFYAADIEPVTGISSMKVVGGALTANLLPTNWVVDASTLTTYPLTVGQASNFTTAARFTNSGSSDSGQLTAFPVGKVFTSTDQVKAWFSTDDAKTALLILQSLTYQQ